MKFLNILRIQKGLNTKTFVYSNLGLIYLHMKESTLEKDFVMESNKKGPKTLVKSL